MSKRYSAKIDLKVPGFPDIEAGSIWTYVQETNTYVHQRDGIDYNIPPNEVEGNNNFMDIKMMIVTPDLRNIKPVEEKIDVDFETITILIHKKDKQAILNFIKQIQEKL